MDDVLLFGKRKAQHNERLHNLITCLARANVTLNKEKFLFGVKQVSFLGHILNKEGAHPHPAKISAITDRKKKKHSRHGQSFVPLSATFIPSDSPNAHSLAQG